MIHTSDYSNAQEAVDACTEGDVLVVDLFNIDVSNPPNGIFIVGNRGTWRISEDIRDLVFFNHQAKILQTGGSLTNVISNSGCRGSRFTHIDSCFFIGSRLLTGGTPAIEVDGFMRSCTFAFTEYSGTPHDNLTPDWIQHHSLLLINATDPVGNGTGSLITGFIAQNAGAWTPIHIINGRGITIANCGSEYSEYADPLVSIENGVECALVGSDPGGIGPKRIIQMNDGTISYGKYLGYRYGIFRIGGMHNYLISGDSYGGGCRASVGNQPWEAVIARDPFLSKWNAANSRGLNFAPNLRSFVYGRDDNYTWRNLNHEVAGIMFSSAHQCTTAFAEPRNKGTQVRAHLDQLPSGSLPAGPRVFRPFTPLMPEIPLENGGPGEDMTGKSGAEIHAKLMEGNVGIFLGEGVYEIPSSIKARDLTIYGAGKSKTRLVFPDTAMACFSGPNTNVYNLTIEGGGAGYLDFDNAGGLGFHGGAVRFVGQVTGISTGNSQQEHLSFCEFDSLRHSKSSGFIQCIHPDMPCGEGNDGNAMIDKFNFYGCVFKNFYKGINPQIGKNGHTGIVGCRFENMTVGVHLRFAGDAGRKSDSHLIAGCTFINCETAADIQQSGDVIASTVIGTGNAKGFTGSIRSVVSCDISGCATAVETNHDYTIVSDVNAHDAMIDLSDNAWIGRSTVGGEYIAARMGNTDLDTYADTSWPVIDVTPPSEPTGLNVAVENGDNILSWQPSSDQQSGILCYLIERQGQEIGRTVLRYSANHHLDEVFWSDDGYPGFAPFREHPTVYVDSGAADSYTKSDYTVHAVNAAMIRSDDTMADIRLFPHLCEPQFTLNTESNTRATDSVTIPMGSLNLPQYQGDKSYKAARYTAESHHSEAVGVRPHHRKRIHYGPSVLKPNAIIGVYTLAGRLVARIPAKEFRAELPAELKRGLGRGIYVIPKVGKRMVIR
ncbi:MAG: hypothetical protein GF363_17925 [Chitinivibrionales bacterium]|nr:hypothetical protein [Chitinivibrionales bacterium]